MKKLKLQLDGKQMLNKEQMKMIVGGYYECATGEVYVSGGGWCSTTSCTEAQSLYNRGAVAICNGVTGTVTGYCCANCPLPC